MATRSPILTAAALLAFPGSTLTNPGSCIQWVECNLTSTAAIAMQDVATQGPAQLPETLRCGQLVVPMNYSHPLGSENNITLGFSMYRPPNPLGLINFNPGGPNAEVASSAWQLALNTTTGAAFQEFAEYDVLAMDQRGTFSSTPINCTLGDYHLPSWLPSNETDFESYQAAISDYAQTCIDQSYPGILAHTSTKETVKDWNSLRQALGYETMHFLTWSYGTYGASLYASEYPEHAGRMVLDGVFPHGLPSQDLVTFQMTTLNRLLLRADAYCLNDTTCPFHTQGQGSVVKVYESAVDLAASGKAGNQTASDIRAIVYLAYLSSSPNFPGLNQALDLAVNEGNWTALTYASYELIYTPAFFEVLPTICLDQNLENNTFEGLNALREGIKSVDTANMEYLQDLTLIVLCGGWPYHGGQDQKVFANTSMMLVTADFDLNTPPNSTFFQRHQLPNSTVVVRHGDDHVSFSEPGPVHQLEVEYLVNGTVPTVTNSTLYTVSLPASEPGAILDPYEVAVGPEAGDVYPGSVDNTQSAE